jgi:AbrB family looped-hinge helix DNA binding protein
MARFIENLFGKNLRPCPPAATHPSDVKRLLHRYETRFTNFQMETVTLSSKYQVVIPRSVRIRLGLRPGMKLQVVEYNGRVEFLPVRKPAEFRGVLKGLEPVIERAPDRL